MISLNIPEVKLFMAKLLTGTTFDTFLLRELELSTSANFAISGQLNEGFFTKEELEERSERKYIFWGEVRAIVFSMIKGNKTPLSLKLVFQATAEQCESLIRESGGKLRPEDVGGLYMNVRFEKGELHIITGTAIKTFTLDKTLEQEWDLAVKGILKAQGIVYEEK